jgi:hypothetical protein
MLENKCWPYTGSAIGVPGTHCSQVAFSSEKATLHETTKGTGIVEPVYSDSRMTVPRNRSVQVDATPRSGDPARCKIGHTNSGIALAAAGLSALRKTPVRTLLDRLFRTAPQLAKKREIVNRRNHLRPEEDKQFKKGLDRSF